MTLCGGEGAEYHPQANGAAGRKLKAALTLRFEGVLASRLLEPVWVFSLLHLAYSPPEDAHMRTRSYRALYEVLLPSLLQPCRARARRRGRRAGEKRRARTGEGGGLARACARVRMFPATCARGVVRVDL